MTVKDIIKTVALLLNRKDILNYLNSEVTENYIKVQEDVNTLVDCYNLVSEEISSTHYKLKAVETLSPKNGALKCSEFTYNPLAVISVKGLNQKPISYKILPSEILTNESKIEVEYYYVPSKKSINDVSDYTNTIIKERVIAYAIATEFLLINGGYEEALVWHEKYINSLKSLLLKDKKKRIKGRIWLWFFKMAI